MYTAKNLDVNNNAMNTLIFEPEGEGPHPGLIIAQHLPVAHAGLEKDPFTINVGNLYAAAGYVCAIPFLFQWWPEDEAMDVKRDAFRDDQTLADLGATFNLLNAREDLTSIDILGHCWGGVVAWLRAANNPNIKACGVFYGGRIKLPFAYNGNPPIELASQIQCPVLGVFGNVDQNPSPEDVNDYQSAPQNSNVPSEFHRYDGAGHGFQDSTNADRYREQHSEDAWQKAIAFLYKHLK